MMKRKNSAFLDDRGRPLRECVRSMCDRRKPYNVHLFNFCTNFLSVFWQKTFHIFIGFSACFYLDEVTAMSLVAPFLGHGVSLACGGNKNKARFPLPELTAPVDGWPVSITRQHGPCWRAPVSTSRVNTARQFCPRMQLTLVMYYYYKQRCQAIWN